MYTETEPNTSSNSTQFMCQSTQFMCQSTHYICGASIITKKESLV
jgi:hypothetical protein